MSTTPSYVGVAGLCAECMRGNVDNDRNYCEKNIREGACDLCTPKPLYRIATEHKQEMINMKLCAITNKKCHRWDGENTTLFCDTCPMAKAHEFYIRNYTKNESDEPRR